MSIFDLMSFLVKAAFVKQWRKLPLSITPINLLVRLVHYVLLITLLKKQQHKQDTYNVL